MNVWSHCITPTTISYKCPECWTDPKGRSHVTNRGKDGRLIRSRKPTIHRHGNLGGQKNQVVARTSHCIHTQLRDVFITINDKTERNGFGDKEKIEVDVSLGVE